MRPWLEGYETAADGHFEGVKGHYTKMEGWLAHKGSEFFVVSDAPTAPDFHMWEMIDQQELAAKAGPSSTSSFLFSFYVHRAPRRFTWRA